jgi:predicted nucleotidyltransferase
LVTTEALWQWETCEQISAALWRQSSVRALWLSGSLARDQADQFSDIDLVALIAGASVDDAVSNIESLLASQFTVVLFRKPGDQDHRLLNLVTDDWKRFDLSIFSNDAIRRSKIRGLRTLFDKDGLDLPVGHGEPPKSEKTAEEVDFVVSEFIRVLGLLPVVLHRDDLVAAVSGSGLLREHLITLLQCEQTGRARTGALNQTESLSAAATSALLGLPALCAEESSILDFNRSCWEIFIQHGPAVSQQYQTEWPGQLVEAVRSRLARDLGMELN